MGKTLQDRCIAAGLKMTGQRKVIISVLENSDNHLSVEMVYERAKAEDSSISLATVYRTMNLLDELDLVIRHDFNESFSRYDVNIDDHYHLIDTETSEVVEFENSEVEAIVRKVAAELGYDLVDHRLEVYGHKKKA
ncbi:MAG: Fur family transcriptional regulator [Pseudomonadota bacterium]|jgi:Fur family ferric uptake transcriptional regulator|nr:transcriptional repressor [Alphaproteobacteria bacterium]MEC7703544.1 Fur family transcriptional regulator [Pseudomonadota bacterium]MCS5596137.1 transcriptional repressor [Alphaproteobacteria bacterium]MEC9236663.1 Fur family transcriptional regulator [Pseudomonadota bacterium]MED5422126.1 Fur family transcriptional regulator [Pseudomonadota bacterium]|tara:strand:+ start:1863 stop:2270 length:408 start_codon:yes stop_codon:yes gene_type:complete